MRRNPPRDPHPWLIADHVPGKCPKGDKIRWRTSLDAALALGRLRSAVNSTERREKSWYRCPTCGSYHTTSLPKSPVPWPCKSAIAEVD